LSLFDGAHGKITSFFYKKRILILLFSFYKRRSRKNFTERVIWVCFTTVSKLTLVSKLNKLKCRDNTIEGTRQNFSITSEQ
jgi:hypothetical protein